MRHSRSLAEGAVRIFVAGATGVIGRRLVPLLVSAGHEVTGSTRSADKVAALERAQARAVVVDVFDAAALARAVEAARPEVVIHQLTDLPDIVVPAAMAESRARNARLRSEGTRNLVDAARAAGARRLIAQSIAFAYVPGPTHHGEGDPIDTAGEAAVSGKGVVSLESAVTGAPGITGIVLRYGRLYGPGTWTEVRAAPPALHVDAAAQAAVLAVTRGAAGIYNIAEDDGAVSTAKARADLAFDPAFRLPA
jgi:nucleoside-diphosphate-sugar epimerase